MKYTTTVEINLPINRVIELFDNADNLKKWQPELISFEHLSGTPGQVGAKSKMLYKMNKREVEMIETITERDLPNKFAGTYEAKGVLNTISNKFEEISPTQTRWIADNDFECKGFMKIMAAVMPGAFKKQTQKYLNQFKQFAETEG